MKPKPKRQPVPVRKTTSTIAVEFTHPQPGQPAWSDDWTKKTVHVTTGPTAADLFEALAAVCQAPTGRGLFEGELETRDGDFTARMVVRLKAGPENDTVVAIVRSPFLRALWRPYCDNSHAMPREQFLAGFSTRSVFSKDFGVAIAPETPKALTEAQQEDALVQTFRSLPDAERRVLAGLLATGRPTAFLSRGAALAGRAR